MEMEKLFSILADMEILKLTWKLPDIMQNQFVIPPMGYDRVIIGETIFTCIHIGKVPLRQLSSDLYGSFINQKVC
jgi:hypothetical protein